MACFSSAALLSAQSFLRVSAASNEQFNAVLPLLAAQFAALKAQLPAAPVSNLSDYIIENNIDSDIAKTIGEFTSEIAIDFVEVKTLALHIYRFRYAMLHGGMESVALLNGALFNISGDTVAQKTREVLSTIEKDAKLNEGFNRAIKILSGKL